MAKTFHKTLRLRQIQGEINRADEIYVPVYLHADEEKGFVWARLTKTAAKEMVEEIEEAGLDEVQGVTIEEAPDADGEECKSLYFDGPDADGDEGEEEEEEEEEKPAEGETP